MEILQVYWAFLPGIDKNSINQKIPENILSHFSEQNKNSFE